MKKRLTILFTFAVISALAQPDSSKRSRLSIQQIMQDPAQWIGTSPSDIRWNDASDKIYFNWNPEQDTLASLYAYTLATDEITKVSPEEKQTLAGRFAAVNRRGTQKVFIRNGNIVLKDLKKGSEKMLTNWLGQASAPTFVMNDTEIAFTKDNNLFTINPESGLIRQITNFTSGSHPSTTPKSGQQQWLQQQQKDLFTVLNEREAKNKARENQRKAEEIKAPLKIYTGKKRVNRISLSPSGNFVAYTLLSTYDNSPSTAVTHFVTQSGYTEQRKARNKVGGGERRLEMGIFDVRRNTTVAIKTTQIPGLKDLPDYLSDYPERMPNDSSKLKNRTVNLCGILWNESNDLAVVTALSTDNKDRWILLLDPATGNLDLLDRQRDEAWIGGPEIGGWGTAAGSMGWMPDGESVWFHSEASGYSHLYAVNIYSKKRTQLTHGNFEVSKAFISSDKKHFYFTANKVHPGVKHFYQMPVWGGEATPLTQLEGGNEVTLSPNEKYLAIRHSTGNRPWELYLQENKPEAQAKVLTHSTTDAFDAYPWRMPEYITFTASDGAKVHARLYRPESPEQQGPAVLFVHGAGYLQNAHKWWSDYFREYQFHNFLADRGYTVLDIDYRGSAGYGRDWRTGIYRHMGNLDLSDQVDGAKMLVEKYGVSPNRIGIYGGSYGGFITLMAMFKNPGVFAAGAALRSVTDWAHYNHGYTSNILNTPVEDSIAYVQSSPIYFADGLQGALLMCHGMVDDNVEFQDIVRLSQRLIELGKENWELAVYPVEAHGFVEPSSWTDEYKRIFKLFEENLRE